MKKTMFSFMFLLLLVAFSCEKKVNTQRFELGNSQYKIIEKYDNGEIKSILYYKNEKKDSIGIWYYQNGQVKISSQFLNGKNTDETIFYYQNGQIKSYYYYNTNGEAIYNKKFSEDGEVILETGVPFYIFTTDSDWSRVKEGDYISFYIYTAELPNTKIRVLIGEKTESEPFNVIYDKDIKNEIPFLNLKINKSGKKEFCVIGELYDEIRETIYRDTVNFAVTVIPE